MKTHKTDVLLTSPYGGVPGGISRWTGHIIEYYLGLDDPEIKLDLLSTARTSFINISTPVFKRIWTGLADYRTILKNYRDTLKLTYYDIVHITSSGSLSLLKDYYMLRKAKHCGAKAILHFRFGRIPELVKKKNWEWWMVKRVARTADSVIVLDKMTYDSLRQAGFDNVQMLPNPISPKVEQIVSNSTREITPKEILFVGHVVPTKGVFELIEAFKGLGNDVRLKIVGHITDPMRQEIISRLSPEESQRVELCGEMPYDDVIKEMIKCDVFVLPTYTEGFPNVILESMAAGCAIVTTPVGAIPQMLEPDEQGEYGLLVPPRDATALRQAIASLLGDEERKASMRQNAKRRVTERYNIDAVWRGMTKIWNKTINDH